MKNPTILVIDDDPVTRKYVSHMLTVAQYQVDMAADGAEALSKAKSFHYDLAIVDLVLPGEMNGLDIIRSLKKHSPHMPVVAFTAYSGQTFSGKTASAGADAFITKNNMSEQLVPTINKLLGRGDDTAERLVEPKAKLVYESKKAPPKVLRGLPEGTIEDILNMAKRVTMEAGKRIAVNYTSEITIIASGRAKCLYHDTVIGSLSEGESIGDESVLLKYDPNNNLSLEAEEELELILIPKDLLEEYFSKHDQNLFVIFQTNIILNLSQKLQKLYNSFPDTKKNVPKRTNGKSRENAFNSDIDIIELLQL